LTTRREGAVRLLAIDDNPRDTRLLEIALSEASGLRCDLEKAPDLTTGLARLARGGIDLVFLDLGLPESQGLDTLNEVQRSHRDVPVVILTGLADATLAEEAARRGAQDYLVKGRMTGELLQRVVRYAVERHRLLGELQRALEATR
jgi:two-component system cell cycle sensor histidine kinase/response regulator CckA